MDKGLETVFGKMSLQVIQRIADDLMTAVRVPGVDMVYCWRQRMTAASSLNWSAFRDVKLKTDPGQRAACLLLLEKAA